MPQAPIDVPYKHAPPGAKQAAQLDGPQVDPVSLDASRTTALSLEMVSEGVVELLRVDA